jgi:hypothetical protein
MILKKPSFTSIPSLAAVSLPPVINVIKKAAKYAI